MNSRENESAWNALFSSLAFAEKAAADECRKIAKYFRESGQLKLADEYDGLVDEENRHHDLALSVTKETVPLTTRAAIVYDGGYFTANGPILERLMSVHFVFEPSALAFLGYVSSHSEELFDDQEWATQITRAFNQILRDEVSHVINGGDVIKKFWNEATAEERDIALRTMRKHRAFLKAGLNSFFKDDDKKTISKMLSRFDFYFEKCVKGVCHEFTEKAAS